MQLVTASDQSHIVRYKPVVKLCFPLRYYLILIRFEDDIRHNACVFENSSLFGEAVERLYVLPYGGRCSPEQSVTLFLSVVLENLLFTPVFAVPVEIEILGAV